MNFQIKPRRDISFYRPYNLIDDPKLRFSLKIMLADKGKQLLVSRLGGVAISDMPKRINNNQ